MAIEFSMSSSINLNDEQVVRTFFQVPPQRVNVTPIMNINQKMMEVDVPEKLSLVPDIGLKETPLKKSKKSKKCKKEKIKSSRYRKKIDNNPNCRAPLLVKGSLPSLKIP
ncbi:hypothetical protein KL915_005382 [Ogataea haglerorum]|nr:hypothetical protein KL915_005382 [Ogataea haglerorum]